MEAIGPAILKPATPHRLSQSDPVYADLIRGDFLPAVIKRRLSRNHSLHERKIESRPQGAVLPAHALVIEILSADEKTHDLSLSLFNTQSPNAPLFQKRLSIGPDYGRFVIEATEIAATVDLSLPYLIQIEPIGEAEGRTLVFGFCDFVRWKTPELATPKPKAKVPADKAKLVIWDLDETLWHGILAEDGIDGLRLRPEAVAAIKTLDMRGILHSVASKNDADRAMAALKHFKLDHYFLYPQVSWNPKSLAVARLSDALSLGVDSFVFIDDQPFERAEVSDAHPMMRIFTHEQVDALCDMACFDVPVTDESRNRRALYREDERRQIDFQTTGLDYRAFLKKSNMVLSLESLTTENQKRIFELSQRTNQLNFTGTKYTESDIESLMNDKDRTKVALRCQAAYGDYGLIGFGVIDLKAGHVERFFMSCRVQKKRVEQAFFAWLRDEVRKFGNTSLSIAYTPTERNGAAKSMMEELGFALQPDGHWHHSLDSGFEDSDIVKIVNLSALDMTRVSS